VTPRCLTIQNSAFHIPSLQIDQSDHCGEQYFTSGTGDQIRAGLGKHLGITAESNSRWFNDGAAQTRSLDKLMRLYFSISTVRAALANPELKEQGSGVPDLAM
jgi:hypothetical protein